MKQLLRIETIPISIEMRTNNARIQRKQEHAEVEVRRDRGGLTVRSRPIKLSVDSFDARNSVTPSTSTVIAQSAADGKSAAYEATARIAQEGQMLLDIHLKQDTLSQIAAGRMENQAEFGLGFIPNAPASIDWVPPDFSIRYEMDRMSFDWKMGKGDFEFIPGSIEVSIKEYNRVVIEYVGGPIYVPPSADPSYVPLDIMV